ncbi:transcriptional adapter 2B [Neocloeon triangulifer]|uniref:transcriptional adapter 2B n=1 Tax=Neocloeon triangulifer TaxID=2078957 RepID=UPI00286F1F04|nr:transcriptional adapter 2B [Neocloeon triangulifer]
MTDIFAKHSCTHCQQDIEGLKIRCATCPDFDLCLQCFACGAEIGGHKFNHPYQFMDSGTVSVFQGKGGWSAKEEMRLLDAIEQFGFGNWEDISKHIESKTSEEAEEEYVTHFLDGNIGKFTWPSALNLRPTLKDVTEPCESKTYPFGRPPMDVTKEEATLLGYMPQRDDFEREFDNDAETLVSSLAVNADDDELETALKLTQVDMYTRRLRERSRRKRISRDFSLVTDFFNAAKKEKPFQKKKISKHEKEWRESLKIFIQFHTNQEFETMISNLVKQDELQLRIRELIKYRKNGITRKEECLHFEQQTTRRQLWGKSIDSSHPIHSALSTSLSKTEEKRGGGSSLSSARRGTQPCQKSEDNSDEGASKADDSNVQKLLSKTEAELTLKLGLLPVEFISIKSNILQKIRDRNTTETFNASCAIVQHLTSKNLIST